MDDRKPMKAKGLKIIDQLGTLYATFDGSKFWELDRLIYKLLMELDGKKTFEELVQKISEKSGVEKDKIETELAKILEDLERNRFIVWV